MNPRLLQWLVCPRCATSLHACPDMRSVSEEVAEGELVCEGHHRFPVTRGIPRLLSEFSQTRADHQTRAAFQYEWSCFADYQLENFRTTVMPKPEAWFGGKLGLDVGCGAGRHLLDAARTGCEMIGVDPSGAIDVTQTKLNAMTKAHAVQADVRALPFRQGSFDFVYSWGVLHHLPDPPAVFRRLLPYLKPGGLVVIGVYQVTLRKRLLELPRVITTRLPLPIVRIIAWVAAVLDYYGVIAPFRLASRVLSPRLARRVPSHIRCYAKHPFRVSETDWFDRLAAPLTHWYTRQEILEWFQQARLEEVRVDPVGDFWWRGEGRVPR